MNRLKTITLALLVAAGLAFADSYESGGTLALSLGNGFTGGTGVDNRVAVWNGTTALDAGLLSDDATNVTLTSGQIFVPVGSASLPSYSFTGDGNAGFYNVTADVIGVTVAAANRFSLSNSAFAIGSATFLGWTSASTTGSSTIDVILARDGAAASLQLGIDTNTPVSQSLEAGDAVSGVSDGSNLVLRGGLKATTGQDGVVVVGRTYTVATLPTGTPVAGARAWVSDALACTFAAAPTGGGAVVCPVFYTGAAWVAG